MEAFKTDFAIYLRHQKSLLSHFKIDLNPEASEEVLEIMTPLKATEIYVFGLSAAQLLSFLPLMDARSIEELKTFTRRQTDVIDEIVEMEQWKYMDFCQLLDFKISDIKRVSHFYRFWGKVTAVSAADVQFLKNAFLAAKQFMQCRVTYDTIADLSDIAAIFGIPAFVSRGSLSRTMRQWFFNMPNKESVLSINLEDPKILVFNSVQKDKVPQDAVIMD